MSPLEEQIINLISENLGIDKEQIKRTSHFFDDFNTDKMMMADLFLSLQEKFKINLPVKETKNVQTVDELIKLVEDHSDEFI